MVRRYYICGRVGTGVMVGQEPDPYRPEIADEVSCSWAANQEMLAGLPPVPQPRFVVALDDPDGSYHAALAYDAGSNPNGYDWLEVLDTGEVVVHAKG